MNMTVKTIIFWIVILLAAIALWQVVKTGNRPAASPEISYSQFLSQIDSGSVAKVRISKTKVDGTYRDGSSFRVFVPASQGQMSEMLLQKNVEVWYADAEQSGFAWLANLVAPLGLLAALWYFMIRQLNKMRTRGKFEAAPASISNDTQFRSS
jgi:cell division protease FtsH